MSGSEPIRTGGCLCGQVRFEASGAPGKVAICHCRMCQRWSAGPFAAAAKFDDEQVRWSARPDLYRSSESLNRSFCPTCGSSLGFQSTSGSTWIALGAFDDPTQLTPQFHLFVEEELPWARLDDGLPRHPQFD